MTTRPARVVNFRAGDGFTDARGRVHLCASCGAFHFKYQRIGRCKKLGCSVKTTTTCNLWWSPLDHKETSP